MCASNLHCIILILSGCSHSLPIFSMVESLICWLIILKKTSSSWWYPISHQISPYSLRFSPPLDLYFCHMKVNLTASTPRSLLPSGNQTWLGDPRFNEKSPSYHHRWLSIARWVFWRLPSQTMPTSEKSQISPSFSRSISFCHWTVVAPKIVITIYNWVVKTIYDWGYFMINQLGTGVLTSHLSHL